MAKEYTTQLTELIQESHTVAKHMRSCHIHPEHILLAMVKKDCDFTHELLKRRSINSSKINESLTNVIKNIINKSNNLNSTTVDNVELTLDSKTTLILRLADLEARMNHDKIIGINHLILAMLHDGIDSPAKDILEENNLNYDDVLQFSQDYQKEEKQDKERNSTQVTCGMDLNGDEDTIDAPEGMQGKNTETKGVNFQGDRKTPVINNFTIDLTDAAANGKIDIVIGREKEIQRLSEILCRRKKNNPILIGEPGVGKSAIVEGLAQMISDNRISPVLHNKRIVSLDLAAMVAGTKYRGQFEERIKSLIKELEQNPDIIVFIDEIHMLVGAGSAAGTMDAANMLKPALARGGIQCIGATTLDEYRKSIEKDGALERRFQKVIVDSTSLEETKNILHNIKSRYEQHHHVIYFEEAIEACVALTERYVSDRSFPDKAIDAMDEAGAKVHLKYADIPNEIIEKEHEISVIKEEKLLAVRNQDFELAATYRDKQNKLEKQLHEMTLTWESGTDSKVQHVTVEDVANVVSTMSGVPINNIIETETERLKMIAQKLKTAVIGQDKAIEKIVKAIQRNRLGLSNPNRPIGVFMFLGPTGVGKTYLTKKLAELMFGTKDSLVRIDMSEYTEGFNASRLVGAPPGYVGYEDGGQLTERVRRKPYCIVLLDEIEKAHGNIYNLLLQVMDEGRLTDGNGRLVDFRNTIIIMTSNTGTRQLKEFGHGVGFNATQGFSPSANDKNKDYARSIIQKSLSKQFAPEFLNRLDGIITFDQLDLSSIRRIIDLELVESYKKVQEIGYALEITDDVKDFIAKKGYDIQYGARPLKRAIQDYIEDYVCERILSGELNHGDTIRVSKDCFK